MNLSPASADVVAHLRVYESDDRLLVPYASPLSLFEGIFDITLCVCVCVCVCFFFNIFGFLNWKFHSLCLIRPSLLGQNFGF